MHVLVIDSNRLLRIETDTTFETVGNREIGGRDQKEQLNGQTHTHVFVQNYFRIDETKLNEMKTQKKHKNSKKSFYKLTAEAPPSPSPPAEIIKIRRK